MLRAAVNCVASHLPKGKCGEQYLISRALTKKDTLKKYMVQVVCTIHQPSSDVCAMFDNMLLLAKGRLLYCGPWTSADNHFWAAGYKCAHQLVSCK